MLLGFLCLSYGYNSWAQSTFNIRGKILDAISISPIEEVVVTIENTAFFTKTDFNGSFQIKNIPIGNLVLLITIDGYSSVKIPINVNNGESIDLGIIYLENSTPSQEEKNDL